MDLGGSSFDVIVRRIRFDESVVGAPQAVVALAVCIAATARAGVFTVLILLFLILSWDTPRRIEEIGLIRYLRVARVQGIHWIRRQPEGIGNNAQIRLLTYFL